jgi:hypothetical protein
LYIPVPPQSAIRQRKVRAIQFFNSINDLLLEKQAGQGLKITLPGKPLRRCSKRTQEAGKLGLLPRIGRIESVDAAGRLAAVAADRIFVSQRLAVVHQPVTRAQTPQRWRAQFARRRLVTVLDNAVAGTDVARQLVGEFWPGVRDVMLLARPAMEEA